jgi:hypothetical protein
MAEDHAKITGNNLEEKFMEKPYLMKTAIERQTIAASDVTKICVGFFIICTIFIAGVRAQSENGSASLEGNVRDQNGAIVRARPLRSKTRKRI